MRALTGVLCFCVAACAAAGGATAGVRGALPAPNKEAVADNWAGLVAAMVEVESARNQFGFRSRDDPPPADAPAPAAPAAAAVVQDECDVCTYVLENKELMQPYLCRGLKEASQQMACVKVLMSLLWWMPNEVYWINYGCQRKGADGSFAWVRPCPPHVICSWLKSLDTGNEKSYCPESPDYRKPQ